MKKKMEEKNPKIEFFGFKPLNFDVNVEIFHFFNNCVLIPLS